MTIYDYIVIVFYLGFMLALGPVFKRFSLTASDYFRGGGGMLWWVVGASSFMTGFTAWSFTGGAAKGYETGTFFMLLFCANFIGLLFTYFVTAARYRQMRVITAIEAVSKRFGSLNEQIFTWFPLAARILYGGIMLYAVAVFMYGIFGPELEQLLAETGLHPSGTAIMGFIIVVMGITAIVMTLMGGAWAATAGDFIQMFIVLTITVLLAVLCIAHPQIGGVSGLVRNLPAHHFDWTQFDRPWVIGLFFVLLVINQTILGNSMLDGASKYVFVKNGKDAKKAVMVPLFGFLLFSPIWLLPAVSAAIICPDLQEAYPALNNPHEAAYVAVAIKLLPKGLLGLLVCAIFAASMTSLNSGLNVASGIFVRNFYIRVLNKGASESRQIMVGRLCTLVYGTLWVVIGLRLASMEGLKLFNLLLVVAGDIGLPAAVPLFFGMFVKRVPAWSGWSTMLLGFTVALALQGHGIGLVGSSLKLTPEFINGLFHPAIPFNAQEIDDLRIALTYGFIIAICSGWFFFTMLFYREEDSAYARQVNLFFMEMKTPVNAACEHGPDYDNDERQCNVLGNLCMIFGGFVLFLVLVPNTARDRLMILAVGGFISIVGGVLRWRAEGLKSREAAKRPPGSLRAGDPASFELGREDRQWLMAIINKILLKMSWLSEKSADKIPYTTVNGSHDDKRTGEYAENNGLQWWTNGFWAGMLWLVYSETGDEKYADIARKTEVWLDAGFESFHGLHHDVGFMWLPSAVADYRLTGNLAARRRGLHAANLLAGRFNPVGRFIRAWDDFCNGDDSRGWSIIDSMLNLSLLYWAGEETGDPRFRHIAMMHADTVMEHFIRPDGSCEHIVEFDPETGRKIRSYRGQGFAEGSAWTRGQAWGLYGFMISYIHTGNTKYLDTAKRIARYFLDHIPESGLIPVDFDQPVEPVAEDSSAAAIAACGFIELARHLTREDGGAYLQAALKLLKTLDERRCNYGGEQDNFLNNCTGGYHDNQHHVSAIYGDYYFMEALLKLKGRDVLFW